ncbi:uncharacterized protein NECHADRAFT_75363 [Fusarium vanettenii 77-13-4]|uniref:Xylanolytic transcriptional activator regulatory domain-containing protein n=1 Tax=Fusarium vanettenii (strain ATCC MYA-4622 / CBS 123669 / FGSC 9596 / NRRL 45880 / 77-13-4) TaxID=660122 RepID=C7YIL3_FUSV7|nr:uncharacterized protein NECHADRAFT_75363 [Fusarium vanettenii 77-13-4]EEU48113.1 hypothetical protein NECHADRAFT_75363 [Fusarium vanettenii 77-13-4]
MANNWYDQQTGLSMSRLSQLSEMAYASPPQPGNVEMRPAVFDRFSPQPLTENPNPSHTTTRPANSLRLNPSRFSCEPVRKCVYAESRRGIRDPNKRKKMKEEAMKADRDESSNSTPSPNFPGFEIPAHVIQRLPAGWTNREAQNPRAVKDLFDLYYANFHPTHSWLPPKKTLSRLVETVPDDFKFTMTMILYVGSKYADNVDSTSLRNDAYEMASGELPETVWSVQALLCMCIAAFGEQHDDYCSLWFDRTRDLALRLGLQHKSFADAEEDPILAESYRRTYWALYTQGSLRTVREHLGHWQLYHTRATTELPCEEWEYESGKIPIPVTLEDYDKRGPSRQYSSWAYFVDLTRICGQFVVPLLNVGEVAFSEAMDNANLRVESWILQMPPWKKDLVDINGAVYYPGIEQGLTVDELQLGIAYGLQIRMQLHYKGVRPQDGVREVASRGFSVLSSSPSPPASVTMGSNPRLPGSAAVQASLHLVSLFNLHLPPENFSPSCILGLERAALPLFDALLYGQGQPVYKVKISLLVSVLRNAGKFWPRSKVVSEEIEEAMRGAADIIEAAEQLQEMQEMQDMQDMQTTPDMFDSPSMDEEDPPTEFAPPVFTTMGQMDSWTQVQPQAANVEPTTEEMAQWLGSETELPKTEEPTLETHDVPLSGPGEMAAGMEAAPLPVMENMTLNMEATSLQGAEEPALGAEAAAFPKTEEDTMVMDAIPVAPFPQAEAGPSDMEAHPGMPMSYVKTEDQWF